MVFIDENGAENEQHVIPGDERSKQFASFHSLVTPGSTFATTGKWYAKYTVLSQCTPHNKAYIRLGPGGGKRKQKNAQRSMIVCEICLWYAKNTRIILPALRNITKIRKLGARAHPAWLMWL